jgi:hypothetical protein
MGGQSAGLFNDPKYKSTNVGFYGQDKQRDVTIGGNPNGSPEEEYIENLQ